MSFFGCVLIRHSVLVHRRPSSPSASADLQAAHSGDDRLSGLQRVHHRHAHRDKGEARGESSELLLSLLPTVRLGPLGFCVFKAQFLLLSIYYRHHLTTVLFSKKDQKNCTPKMSDFIATFCLFADLSCSRQCTVPLREAAV